MHDMSLEYAKNRLQMFMDLLGYISTVRKIEIKFTELDTAGGPINGSGAVDGVSDVDKDKGW